MPRKKWISDGPRQSSQPWQWDKRAFPGKAYPNPIPGEKERDQARADEERHRRLVSQDELFKNSGGETERRIAERRREKKGRNVPPLHRPRGRR